MRFWSCFMHLLATALLAVLLAFVSGMAYAAPSLSDYGALPTVDNVALSPDGKLLAFKRTEGGKEILAVVSIADGKFVRGLDVSRIKLRNLYFFSNSKLISVTAEHRRVLGYRGKFDVSTAFLLDLESGGISQLLTPGDVVYVGQSGLGRIAGSSADGRHVFMPAYVGSSAADHSPNYSLVRVDLDSPGRPSVVAVGKEYTEDYFMDGAGKLLAEERFNSRASTHSIISYRDGGATEIFSQKVDIPGIGVVGVTPDRQALVISYRKEGAEYSALSAMSLKDGSVSAPLFVRSNADVETVITDVNRTVFGVMYSGLRPTYEFFDAQLTKRMQAIVDAHPGHSVWLVDWSDDWQHLLIQLEGVSTSGQYLLYSNGKPPKFLTASRPNIKPEHVNPVTEFSYKARDGMIIPALVTVPRAKVDALQNLPAVMLPHGGPAAHDWMGFDWLAQALASRGYLVIQPQFRGSSGFGFAHWSAGHGEWGRKMQDDLDDGLNALVAQKLVDPKRVCIVGASYGGYAALMGGARSPDKYKCVVSINGVTDLKRMLADERSSHGRDHYVVRYWKMLIAKGEIDNRALEKISPSYLAADFTGPVLLLHGKADEVVDFTQAKLMQKSLSKAKKQVKLVALKNEDHFLSKSETRLKALTEITSFLDAHLER